MFSCLLYFLKIIVIMISAVIEIIVTFLINSDIPTNLNLSVHTQGK